MESLKNCSVREAAIQDTLKYSCARTEQVEMRLLNLLAALLLGSSVTLSIGAVLLYVYNLVPDWLIELTALVVVILVPLSNFVIRGNKLAINISTILGVVAPLSSFLNQAHVAVLLAFGQNLLISILGLLQFLGFYLCPIVFVGLRVAYWKRISLYSKSAKQPVKEIANSKQTN